MANNALWTSAQLSEALGQHVPAGIAATGVSIDTRTLKPGEIFLALPGENVDGHTYVAQAFEKGAAAALVAKKVAHEHAIQVPDVLEALEKMAAHRRAQTQAPCIALTGSVGKTSTKEMLLTCLSSLGRTHANVGNFNNHIGLPLTMARLPLDAEYAVFELGMNHAGELRELTNLLQPDMALITTIAPQHLEFFDSVERIAEAKAELLEGVKKGGIAVLPVDNSYYAILAAKAKKHGLVVKDFGTKEGAHSRLLHTEVAKQGQKVQVVLSSEKGNKKLDFSIGCMGAHHALNAAGVLLLLEALGHVEAIQALKDYKATKGRGKIHQLAIQGCRFTLVDESYNAGPASMEAALSVLGQMKRAGGSKALAVLGDMLELGENEAQFHAGLAEPIHRAGVDAVFTVGKRMRKLAQALPAATLAGQVDSAEELNEAELLQLIKPYDLIMVKGSNGSRSWKLVETIINNATKQEDK